MQSLTDNFLQFCAGVEGGGMVYVVVAIFCVYATVAGPLLSSLTDFKLSLMKLKLLISALHV